MKTDEEFIKTENTESELTDDEAEGAAGGFGLGGLDHFIMTETDYTHTTYFVCTNENCSRWGADSVHKSNEHPICPSCGQPLVVHQSGMVFVKRRTIPAAGKLPTRPIKK